MSTGSYAYTGPQTTNPPFFHHNANAAASVPFDMPLESSNIQLVSSAAGGNFQCAGWEDAL